MLVGFVQAAPALIVVVVWTLILILGGGYTLGEMMRLATGKQPLWKKALLFPLRVIGGRIDKLVKTLVARASHAFVLSSPAVARMLHRTASEVEDLTGEILQLSAESYQTFRYIRTTLVPVLIQRAVAPLQAQLTRHTERLNALEDLNRQVSVVIGNGLRTLPWGVPGTYVGNFNAWWNTYTQLWKHVYNTVTPRVNTLWSERVPNLRNRIQALEHTVDAIQTQALPALRLRIGKIETWLGDMATDPTTWMLGLLGAAMLPALSAVGMRNALRNLTCRNTQTLTRNICQQDEALMDGLTGFLFAVAIIGNLEWYVRGMQAVVGETTSLIHGALDPGDRSEVASEAA